MKIKKKSIQKLSKKETSAQTSLTTQWTIRGISLESRQAAQKAAEKAHEFIGSWVSRALLDAAHAQFTAKKEIARPEDMHDILKDMQLKFSQDVMDLSAKIDKLSQKRSLLTQLKDKVMGYQHPS